jgi:hypothetical protein
VAVRQYKVIAGINAAERAGPAKTKDRREPKELSLTLEDQSNPASRKSQKSETKKNPVATIDTIA